LNTENQPQAAARVFASASLQLPSAKKQKDSRACYRGTESVHGLAPYIYLTLTMTATLRVGTVDAFQFDFCGQQIYRGRIRALASMIGQGVMSSSAAHHIISHVQD